MTSITMKDCIRIDWISRYDNFPWYQNMHIKNILRYKNRRPE